MARRQSKALRTEEEQDDESDQSTAGNGNYQQSKSKMMTKGKEMMSGDMMGSMMSKHQEMSKLVDQVTADLAALQGEKDIAIIKKKMAADQTLLEQLKTRMQQQQGMMGPMMERMKMMDNAGKQAPAK